jgi:Leucine-rich repeat (LRR) protein
VTRSCPIVFIAPRFSCAASKVLLRLSKLKTLENLYLNDEKNLDLPQSLDVLAKLPNLKSLYLDNDRINYMPTEMLKLQNLEYLSLRQIH